MIFGEPLLRFESVTSTQDVARERALAGAAPGTVIAARSMTAGRGRRGRRWHMLPDAAVCLTAIAPPVAPEALWQLAPLVGLAVAEAAGAETRVKFPNDVTLAGRKLAGVLIETVAIDSHLMPLIGMGVNVCVEEFPAALAGRAISLHEVDPDATVAAVEAAILARLSARWAAWTMEGVAAFLEDWNGRLDTEAPRTFLLDAGPIVCRVVAMHPNGDITLALPGGDRRRLPGVQAILGDEP